jgi:hypothetical protein
MSQMLGRERDFKHEEIQSLCGKFQSGQYQSDKGAAVTEHRFITVWSFQ